MKEEKQLIIETIMAFSMLRETACELLADKIIVAIKPQYQRGIEEAIEICDKESMTTSEFDISVMFNNVRKELQSKLKESEE